MSLWLFSQQKRHRVVFAREPRRYQETSLGPPTKLRPSREPRGLRGDSCTHPTGNTSCSPLVSLPPADRGSVLVFAPHSPSPLLKQGKGTQLSGAVSYSEGLTESPAAGNLRLLCDPGWAGPWRTPRWVSRAQQDVPAAVTACSSTGKLEMGMVVPVRNYSSTACRNLLASSSLNRGSRSDMASGGTAAAGAFQHCCRNLLALNKDRRRIGSQRWGELEFLRQMEKPRVEDDIHLSSQPLPPLLVCPSKTRIWGMFAFGRSHLPSYLSASVTMLRSLTARGWYLPRLLRYGIRWSGTLCRGPFSLPRWGWGHTLRGLSCQPAVWGAYESLCWRNSSQPPWSICLWSHWKQKRLTTGEAPTSTIKICQHENG